MSMRFIRGSSQAPKGHAIFIAQNTSDPGAVYCTYCIVPPIPFSLAKYLPPMFAAQISPEELREATNVTGMPIPPVPERAKSLQYLEMLAERRNDDLVDIGSISGDDGVLMQMVAYSSQEYGQLYSQYINSVNLDAPASVSAIEQPVALSDLDTEELFIQTMGDRQKLTELGKLIGTARYALEGRDIQLQEETKRRMQAFTNALPDKYRGAELIKAVFNSDARGARLAELYLSRAFKLVDEEYADIPG